MLVVKAGGGRSINWDGLAVDLAEEQTRSKIVLIHGGNAARNDLAARLNVPVRRVISPSGISSVYTDKDALDVFLMAYPGLTSTGIVARLRRHGLNAVGLSGVDGGLWRATAKREIPVRDGDKIKLLRGNLTGRVDAVDGRFLEVLLEAGYLPVLCAPALDEEGNIVNVDNDLAAAATAIALRAGTMVFLFEAAGFLADPNDPESRVAEIQAAEIGASLSGAAGGMGKKLIAVSRALAGGVQTVYFGDGRVEHPLRDALAGRGTVLKSPPRDNTDVRLRRDHESPLRGRAIQRPQPADLTDGSPQSFRME
ncbi:MAG: [LysW]-aminoadipate kinase [Candidatus Aminicenantes bacterium]|nr:[LysW]-aminoadipate kinase [Candidatus Aminicenantes bacterium]